MAPRCVRAGAQVTDPRFGRLAENFGEDPYLVSSFGLSAMAGIQGELGPHVNASTYIPDPVRHPICQVKHFAMYGASAKDSYTCAQQVSESALHEVYLVPWRELAAAGLRGVMA